MISVPSVHIFQCSSRATLVVLGCLGELISASVFKIKQNLFGYFHPQNILIDNENKYFSGDLTDVSAQKEALELISTTHVQTTHTVR